MAAFYSLKSATEAGSSSQQVKSSHNSESESKSSVARFHPTLKTEQEDGVEIMELIGVTPLVKQENEEKNELGSSIKVEEGIEIGAIRPAREPYSPTPPPRGTVAPRFYSKINISTVVGPKNRIRLCYRHYWDEGVYRYPVAAAPKNGIRFYHLNSRMARTPTRHSLAPVALRRSLRIQQKPARSQILSVQLRSLTNSIRG